MSQAILTGQRKSGLKILNSDEIECILQTNGLSGEPCYIEKQSPKNILISTKLTNPTDLPAGTSYGCSWSPDGTYLSVAHNESPYITIYKREGDVFTKLTNPTYLPSGTGRGCSWSPDGSYLSVAHYTSPYITIYNKDEVKFNVYVNNIMNILKGKDGVGILKTSGLINDAVQVIRIFK